LTKQAKINYNPGKLLNYLRAIVYLMKQVSLKFNKIILSRFI